MHDRIFKGLLRAFLPDLLRLVVPQAAEQLDLSSPNFVDKELFTDWLEGTRRELDLLASLPLRNGGHEHVLVHVEIEARATAGMARRLRSYRSQIESRHDCWVLPVVVYVRRGIPGIHVLTLEAPLLKSAIEGFRYYAFGLAGCGAEEFLGRPEPLAWALAALMDPGPLRRAEHKHACLRRIFSAGLNDVQRRPLVNCVESYLQLTQEEAVEFEALGRLAENREVRTMALTWEERMIAKGREEGIRLGREEARQERRQEARQEGRKEGRKLEARRILLDVLRARFGTVPNPVRQQIAEIESVDRLRLLARRVVKARTLQEIGLA